MRNYDIYSKEFQKLHPTHGGTISNSENGKMVYINSFMLCVHFQINYHMVVIFITLIYMVLMMSPCVCGVVMLIRIEWCF